MARGELFNFAAEDPEDPKYEAICWHQCYFLNHLWEPGEIYHGDIEPPKWFSKDGKGPKTTTRGADLAVDDVRSTVELKVIAQQKYGIEINDSMSRKQIHGLVRAAEKRTSRSQNRTPKPKEVPEVPQEKPLKKMSKAELFEKAQEIGLDVNETEHHFSIRKKIQEAINGDTG
jgi:hypothetical protein